MLPVGTQAPDFRLRLDNGDVFRLSDFRGRNHIILTFLPHAVPFDQAREGYVLLRHLQEARELGAEVVAVSPFDLRPLRDFVALYHLSLPFAADPSMEVCRIYRVVWLRGAAVRRTTYVIDRAGIVRGRLNHEFLVERHWGTVVRLLKDLNDREELRSHNRKAWNL